MPDLPTFTVTQTVADRIVAAFANQTDDSGNPLTAVQAYKRWLRTQVTSYVVSVEGQSTRTALETNLPI